MNLNQCEVCKLNFEEYEYLVPEEHRQTHEQIMEEYDDICYDCLVEMMETGVIERED